MKKHLWIYLKGIAMGAADVVPGVSGGTIAFITGIYDNLLSSISNINLELIKTLQKEGFAKAWEKINGNFLIVLLAGIATSILSLAKLITYLMHHYPIQLWSFFFGLIVASIFYVAKEITRWRWVEFIMLFLGAAFIFWISILPPLASNDNHIYLFFAGAIAACAMILPGISGSFILLILGAYSIIIAGIADRNLLLLTIVALGAITGLLAFSKLLNYLLAQFHDSFIAVLVGFLIGSLWKIWPWKVDEQIFVKEEGIQAGEKFLAPYRSLTAYFSHSNNPDTNAMSYIERNISPFFYEHINPQVSNQLFFSIIFAIIGFSILFTIEFIAKKQNG
ncbi:Domain of uncharacterised function (DUF368) [Candidatus Ornithobacterium hominis]|uniref:Domain of uncharacterized function (DUF368) n=1 Tax=Candidatus Ornithobacterium hominis TaxID=2497989 RepID=A0A383U0E9_9FLAO|nr:DUF368 domain-containing protein [Candidatus Ornithobacterium hominis]MCT7904285.1 DUF368 domain-containing protein [Candidatus Ornithobacterium hominis]SZD72948.1 Domain of uncharacterised function (DUF368) [Candidatus Ornithobacterium hominis]